MIYIIHMQFTFTTLNWLLQLAAALCVVYSSVAVNTTVVVLTLLAGVAALKK